MISFILCFVILILGYLFYGKYVDGIFNPDDRETPAVAINDGVDYVVMPEWKLFLVQLLNIAGTGPILKPGNNPDLSVRIHLFFLRKEQLRLFVQMKQHLNGYFFFKFLFPCGEFRVEGMHASGLRVFCRKVTHMLCIWISTDVKGRPVFRKDKFRFPGSKLPESTIL